MARNAHQGIGHLRFEAATPLPEADASTEHTVSASGATKLDPDCIVVDGVCALLGPLVQAMSAAETGIRDDTTIGSLHQFRVATRHIRTLLGEIKGVLPPARAAQIRAELR